MANVSVIVPVYNTSRFLRKCVESILSQTYRNIELVLVDDGSTDGSAAICDEIAAANSCVRVIHTTNKGVSSARNTGIDAASGKWICFVDGDDWIHPTYIEHLLNLVETTDCPVAVMRSVASDFDERQPLHEKHEVWTGDQALIGTLCYRLPIGCYARIISRTHLEKCGTRFFEELVVGEGFNFNCSLFRSTPRVAVSNMKLYHYRKDNAYSVTTNFDVKKWSNGLYAMQLIKQRASIDTKEFDKAWAYAWWRTNSDAYDLVVLSHSEETCPEFYRRVLNVTRSQWTSALGVRLSMKDKIRAFVMGVCPRMIPWAMRTRRRIHQVEVSTQE